MQNIQIPRTNINPTALDEQLRTQFGEVVYGLSFSNAVVTVHLADEANAADLATAKTLVEQHDASVLSASQTRKQAESQAIETARSTFTSVINPDDYSGESAAIQELVERLEWLEREIRDLRGL